MAEAKKPAEPKVEAKAYARAAETDDPAVQWLLAEQAAHGSYGNAEKVAEMERRLNELGYTSK